MTDILNTIRNARDGSMVDIRYDEDGKGAIASFPIADLLALRLHELQYCPACKEYGFTETWCGAKGGLGAEHEWQPIES